MLQGYLPQELENAAVVVVHRNGSLGKRRKLQANGPDHRPLQSTTTHYPGASAYDAALYFESVSAQSSGTLTPFY